jgi:protein TonB
MNLFSFTKDNLDEVVFEHRNKQYGAYVLRKSYDENLLKAAASSFGLLLLFGSSMYLVSLLKPHIQPLAETIQTVTLDQTLINKVVIVPDEQLLPKSKVMNTDNMRYRIVRDHQVVQTLTTPPDPTRALNPQGSQQQSSGGSETGIIAGTGTAPAVVVPVVESQPIATFATDMPSFDGGSDAMARYIRKELVYPPQAMEFEREGRVMVSFVVQTDGSITDITVLKGFGFGSEEEAKRVIEKMPKWIPGKQNGKLLPVRLVLPLQFQLR